MKINKEKGEGYIKFNISGDLDATESINMDNEIKKTLQETSSQILIDCSNLDYISSAGLGVFVSNIQDIKNQNGTLVLYALKESVFNTFKVLGLDKIIHIVKNENEAKGLLQKN